MIGGICDVLTNGVEFKWKIRQFSRVKVYMESVSARCHSSEIYSNDFCTKLSDDMDNKYWHLKLENSRNGTYKIVFKRNYLHNSDLLDGKNIKSSYDAMFVHDDETLKATISVEFFILNNKQKKEKLNDAAKVYFRYVDDFYSYPLSSSILKDEKFVFNDTLTIICNILEYGKPTTHPIPPLENFPKYLLKNIKNLLNSEGQDNVTLIVDETEFKVHKIILSALSPVFAAMFSHKEFEESQTHQVVIKDTNAETMKKFVQFIYSGRIKKLNEERFALWILADKYQIESLKNYCEQLISFEVNEQCVLEVLKFADLYNIENLLDQTLNYFVTYCKNTIKNGEWKCMAKTNPKLFDLILDRIGF